VFDKAGSVLKEFKNEPLVSGKLFRMNLMCTQATPLHSYKASIFDPNDDTTLVHEGEFQTTSNKTLAHQVVKKVLTGKIAQTGEAEDKISLSKKYSVLHHWAALIAYERITKDLGSEETELVKIPINPINPRSTGKYEIIVKTVTGKDLPIEVED